ncbi:uncharacterized protein JCM6883_005265 [Sporobolomyces salmoneus]|uniref:uncharacterized protein n=1 Tax=Sporobolomyces salmoneus TaxID=183962 RepID=UPI0031742807
MSPTSISMRLGDSQESYSSEPPPAPYDGPRGSPPDYASPPLTQQGDDETPLIVHQKRQPKIDGPMSVDDFAYEMGRVAYDINALRDIVEGIENLKADLSSQGSPISTLEALARRTTSASPLLSTSVPSLRTLRSTIPYLKPAAGAFVVSNSQTVELKQQLAQCAQTLKDVLGKISAMERREEDTEKKDTRMRLLKFIKEKEGEGVESSELMAQLLGAERDGSRATSEALEVNSYAWRWVVERPGCRLARSVDESGDLTFLHKIEYPPAPSVWANTWAFLPSLYPSNSTNRKTSGYSAAGTKESMPIDANDEETTGNYGEPLSDGLNRRPSRYKLWLVVLFVLLLMAGAGLGIGFWVKSFDHATSRSETGDPSSSPLSTFVNRMPAHPTIAS